MSNKENIAKEEFMLRKGIVHFVLLHSYLIYFFAVIIGVIFDIFTPIKFFSNPIYQKLGVFMILIGTVLIYWAQSSSGLSKKDNKENITTKSFQNGPYKYFLSPTHLGLFTMTLGLGVVLNSIISVLTVLVAHILAKTIFFKKQEKILERKYGKAYTDYKKNLNNWL